MNKSLKKAIFILTVLLWALPLALPPGLFAQVNSGSAAQAGRQKYALVIGNSDYTVLPALDNTVNDADDVAVALLNLGFTVNKLINGTLVQTENSIAWLIKQLGTSKNNY
ncbi:MAG: caspase family protein, partial [Treponema sp.]|nr:caspase family protein [Treponema sp.]